LCNVVTTHAMKFKPDTKFILALAFFWFAGSEAGRGGGGRGGGGGRVSSGARASGGSRSSVTRGSSSSSRGSTWSSRRSPSRDYYAQRVTYSMYYSSRARCVNVRMSANSRQIRRLLASLRISGKHNLCAIIITNILLLRRTGHSELQRYGSVCRARTGAFCHRRPSFAMRQSTTLRSDHRPWIINKYSMAQTRMRSQFIGCKQMNIHRQERGTNGADVSMNRYATRTNSNVTRCRHGGMSIGVLAVALSSPPLVGHHIRTLAGGW